MQPGCTCRRNRRRSFWKRKQDDRSSRCLIHRRSLAVEQLEDRWLLSGLSVITHGWQFLADFQDWPVDMANEIIANAGSGKRIDLEFDDATITNGASATLAPSGETVVVFDWSDKSDNITPADDAEPGWREAAGDLLANWLLGTGLAHAAVAASAPIHFIGHSFGTVVNSEAIRRLGVFGIEVDQMTTLDPHDQDQDWIADAKDYPGDHPWDEPKVTVWSNVEFADNYWEDNAGSPTDPTDNTLVWQLPVGHPIQGAAQRDLTDETEVDLNEASAWAAHSRIHEWYYQTINGSEHPEPGGYGERPGDNWYPAPLTVPTSHGYALSATGADRSQAHLSDLDMTPASAAFNNPVPNLQNTVFNGDFGFYEPDGLTEDLPGYDDWDDPKVVYADAAHEYVAELSGAVVLQGFTHRPVYFSPTAEYFSFDFNVQEAGGGDFLRVTVDGLADDLFYEEISSSAPGWQHAVVAVPATLRGTHGEFTVKLVDPGLSMVNSEVWIDNLLIEQPSIAKDETNIDFGYGSTSQTFQVWNDITGTLNYTASVISGGAYFSLDLTQGTSTGSSDKMTHTVTADRSSISPSQTVTGRIRIESANANDSPQYIELTASAGSLIVSTTTDENDGDYSMGDLSLREALALAADRPGTDYITFDSTLAGSTITLNPAFHTLIVDSDVEIHGPGAGELTIRNGSSRAWSAFLVENDVTATISGLAIVGNDTSYGGLKNEGVLTIASCTFSGGWGGVAGGVYNVGTITLVDSTLSNNNNYGGVAGGIWNEGEATIINSAISGNWGMFGGGIYNTGMLTLSSSITSANIATNSGGGIMSSNDANTTIIGSDISNNSAGSLGGGIYDSSGGTLSISNSVISENSATNDGGGIYQGGGSTLIISSSLVSNNTATGAGGGICSWGASTTISDSTISNNSANEGSGGGVFNSGASTTISDSTISDNSAKWGGGIRNQGDLAVTSSRISSNSANEGSGGGVSNSGDITLTSSTITGNTSTGGSAGGIYNSGTLTIDRSMIDSNSATEFGGGGIFNSSSGELVVSNSTISDNSVDGLGGGILNWSGATLIVANSTISGNTATSATHGGGIFNFGEPTLTNCTVFGNSSGIENGSGTIATLHNTIVAGNSKDVGGTFSAASSHNIIGVIDGSSNFDLDARTQFGTAGSPLDPMLGSLDDNGGPTLTHALLPGSPAIDAGSNDRANDAGLTSDQRGPGFERFTDCDADGTSTVNIGAYENQGTVPAEIRGGIWNDLDGDDEWAPWESGLENWTVYLDLNNDDTADPTEPSTKTDTNGKYMFAILEAGTYTVASVQQAGWALGWPISGSYEISVRPNQLVTDVDFGNYEPAGIRGNAWNDLDANGEWDDGEPALAGWKVYLDLDNDSSPDAGEPLAVTNLSGQYEFTDLEPRTYTIAALPEDGWGQTFPSPTATMIQALQNPTLIEEEHFGSSAVAFGDNILVGAPYHDSGATDAGVVYLLEGSTGALIRTFQNPTPSQEEHFGASVVPVGDNVLIAAHDEFNPYYYSGYTDTGAVYLFDGSTGALLQAFQNPAPTANDRFGYSVAAFGDNVLVGAPWAYSGATAAGVVYLFDGSTGALLRTFRDPSPSSLGYFGASVVAAGKTVLVGAPGSDIGAYKAGAVYAFDGSTGTLLQRFRSPTPSVWDLFGESIAAIGENVVIGSSSGLDFGAVWLFNRSTGVAAHTFENPTANSGADFGLAVAGIGDDVLVGAPGDSGGVAYLFDSSTGTLLETFQNPNSSPSGSFGHSVTTIGSNILIGAPFDDVGANNAGSVYVFATGVGTHAITVASGQVVENISFGNSKLDAYVDLSLVLQPTAFDNDDTGEVGAIPGNKEWIDEWDSFYVEVWVSTPNTADTGVVSAQVDLTYNTDYFTATGIEYGPGFDLLQIGIIDDAAGVVDDLGAGTLAIDVGDDQHALLARVRFEPTVDDAGVPLGTDGKYITPVDNGFGLDNTQITLVGNIAADVELGDLPKTELWPVMYDIDDSGLIDFGDFTFFATAFAQDVEGGSPWYVWASDFDRSGLVDFGDFTFFATNFAVGKTDGIERQYPGNFPGDWRPSPLTLEVPLAPSQGSAALVTDKKLNPIVSEAMHRLEVSEGSEAKVILENATVEVVDLPGDQLGQSVDNRVWIDLDAAGYGRFIDATPGDDVEFSQRTGTDELMATLDSPARGRVDLLTTLMHEFGHALGYEHTDKDDATLPLSTRWLLSEESLFSSFASDEEDADDFWDDQELNAEVLDEVFGWLGA